MARARRQCRRRQTDKFDVCSDNSNWLMLSVKDGVKCHAEKTIKFIRYQIELKTLTFHLCRGAC